MHNNDEAGRRRVHRNELEIWMKRMRSIWLRIYDSLIIQCMRHIMKFARLLILGRRRVEHCGATTELSLTQNGQPVFVLVRGCFVVQAKMNGVYSNGGVCRNELAIWLAPEARYECRAGHRHPLTKSELLRLCNWHANSVWRTPRAPWSDLPYT